MKYLIISGGRQRRHALDLDEWQAYEKGLLIRYELEAGKSEVVVEYETPRQYAPAELPSITFKAGGISRRSLYVCTQTEVVVFDVDSWKQLRHWTDPILNDVHHVFPRGDSMWVANTGCDNVLEVAADSRIISTWHTAPNGPRVDLDMSRDLRLLPTTKPHPAHTNFVFEFCDAMWATRFQQKDAIRLDKSDRLDIAIGSPHDGIPLGNRVFFTTVNGFVVSFSSQDLQRSRQVFDLNQISRKDQELGWCRGILPISESRAWVGFSRLRPTKLRENLSWIKQGFRKLGTYNMQPTRIALFDFAANRCEKEIDLESVGLNAVFGIYGIE